MEAREVVDEASMAMVAMAATVAARQLRAGAASSVEEAICDDSWHGTIGNRGAVWR